MNVVVNTKEPVKFLTLKPGDVFLTDNNRFYMKMDHSHCNYNSVDVQDGFPYLFDPTHEVIPVNCHLVIE